MAALCRRRNRASVWQFGAAPETASVLASRSPLTGALVCAVDRTARFGRLKVNLIGGIGKRLRPRASSKQLSAWSVSVSLHIVLLAVFASFGAYTVKTVVPMEIETRLPEDVKLDELQPDFELVADDLGAEGVEIGQLARGLAPVLDEHSPVVPQSFQRIDQSPLRFPEAFAMPRADELSPAVRIGGSAGEHVAGVKGAVDRLTFEIVQSLKQRKTVVAWVLDTSGSLEQNRDQVAERLERVYSELQTLGYTENDSLLSTVVYFGQRVEFPMGDRPSGNVEKVQQAIREATIDDSGIENVFAAVGQTAERLLDWRRRSRRNVLIIVLTDEKGSDEARVEDVIALTRRYGIVVYVLGYPAVFGREHDYIPWTDPNGEVHQIPVDRGPESAGLERLRLAFWRGTGTELQTMSSGFGPHSLTRLTRETGGLYLITDEGHGPYFDPDVLRDYQPEYVSRDEYLKRLQSNRAMFQLVTVAENTSAEELINPRLLFPAPDDATLRRVMTESQKPAAKFDYTLRLMAQELVKGERDRDKITVPRWRAAFDLAFGRVAAMRVRTYGYNVVLAQMKGAPKRFTNPQSNAWRLVPSEEVAAGPDVEKGAETARTYLTRVIENHPDTPWAVIAQTELSQPLGWKWVEDYIPPPPDRPNRPNNVRSIPKTDPAAIKQAKPKPVVLPKY